MRRVFTWLLFLLPALPVFSQKVIFSQNFNLFPTYYISGWNTQQHTGPQNWSAGQLYQVNGDCHGGPFYERVAGICNCPPLGSKDTSDKPNHNVFMFTPKIDLTASNQVWLKFDSYFNKFGMGSDTEKATIEISTNGGASWTVLLDVKGNKNIKSAETWHLDLSAYANIADVRIGFRYDDAGLNVGGWAVDNVVVFMPAKKDVALTKVTPDDSLLRYRQLGQILSYGGEVYNAGLDTVTEYIIHYQQDGKSVKSDTTTGVSIPPFASHSFIHKIPDTAFGERAGVKIWVEVSGDTVFKNNSLNTDIRGAYFMPVKRPIVEEGTGTWHPEGPRGWVHMNRLFDSTWGYTSLVSVHSGDSDPMDLDVYDSYLFHLDWNYVPFVLLDRRNQVDADSLQYRVKRQRDFFGFASVDFTYQVNGDDLIVTTHVKPAVDMEGDFRIALIITEDEVRGTDKKWGQVNKYAGNKFGPMGGFESKPDTVPASEMYYNFVARAIAPGPEGKKGLLPAKLVHNTEYVNNISTKLKPEWNKERIKFIVLLMRADDTTILNSNEVLFALDVAENAEVTNDIRIYPNPAREVIRVEFGKPVSGDISYSISDIGGRLLAGNMIKNGIGQGTGFEIPLHDFRAGLYLLSVHGEGFYKTMKFIVIH